MLSRFTDAGVTVIGLGVEEHSIERLVHDARALGARTIDIDAQWKDVGATAERIRDSVLFSSGTIGARTTLRISRGVITRFAAM